MNNVLRSQLSNRLARAEGHLKKVRKMLDDGIYCPDVIHQSQAVQAALKKVDEIILHSHLHTCVLKDIHGSNKEKEKMVKEILEVFEKQK